MGHLHATWGLEPSARRERREVRWRGARNSDGSGSAAATAPEVINGRPYALLSFSRPYSHILPRPKPVCHCACVRACVRACSEQSNAQLQWRTRRIRPESAPLQAQPKRRLRPGMRGTARTVRVKCRRFSAISTSSMPRSLHGGERQTIPPFLNSPLTWPPTDRPTADACHVARCMLSVVRHVADDPARF